MRAGRAFAGGLGALALGVVGASGPASAATNNTERFLFVNTSATASSNPVSATGPIHALGKNTSLGNNRDRLTFPAGTIVIQHQQTSATDNFDKTTCTDQFTGQGTYRVLSGTGAYAHATGHGTYQASGIAIGCNPNKPPSTFSFIIRAAGPLNI